MFTMIGKKLIRKAVRMAGPAPMPNQTTRIGTNAALGSALNAVISGYTAVYATRELPIRKPSSTPTTIDSPKPAIVTQKVRQAWPAIVAACSFMAEMIAAGLGKMNSDTPNAEHSTCHSTSTATSRIHGDQRSIVLLFIARSPSGWRPVCASRRCGRAAHARCW